MKHTLISMPSKARAVSNVVVKTIISKSVLTIQTIATMTKVTISNTQFKGQRFHRSQGDENSIEQSLQTLTSLIKSLLKQTSQSQSSYHKPSYKSYDNKQKYSGHKSYNKSHHNKGKYRHNTRINELGKYTSDASSCSDQSDMGEEFD